MSLKFIILGAFLLPAIVHCEDKNNSRYRPGSSSPSTPGYIAQSTKTAKPDEPLIISLESSSISIPKASLFENAEVRMGVLKSPPEREALVTLGDPKGDVVELVFFEQNSKEVFSSNLLSEPYRLNQTVRDVEDQDLLKIVVITSPDTDDERIQIIEKNDFATLEQALSLSDVIVGLDWFVTHAVIYAVETDTVPASIITISNSQEVQNTGGRTVDELESQLVSNPLGVIDKSFAIDGIHNPHNILGGPDTVWEFLYQGLAHQDGKGFYVVGMSPDTHNNGIVDSYDLGGEMRNSFGTEGRLAVKNTFAGGHDFFHSIVQDTEGNIYTAGTCYDALSGNICVWGFDGNGQTLSSFGTGGVLSLKDIAGGTDTFEHVRDMILTSDQKLMVVGGSGTGNGKSDGFAFRANLNGTVDSSFAANGILIFSDVAGGDGETQIKKLVPLDGGKYLAIGMSHNLAGDFDAVAIAIDEAGQKIASFGSNGTLVMDSITEGNGDDQFNSAARNSNGTIILTGTSANEGFLMRLTQDGRTDSRFGINGIVAVKNVLGETYNHKLQAMMVDEIGRIYVCGNTGTAATGNDFLVGRFSKDGTLDSSFGEDGYFVKGVTNSISEDCRDILVFPSGEIFIIGKTGTSTDGDHLIMKVK